MGGQPGIWDVNVAMNDFRIFLTLSASYVRFFVPSVQVRTKPLYLFLIVR